MGFLKTIKGLFNSEDKGDDAKRIVPSDSPKQRVRSAKDDITKRGTTSPPPGMMTEWKAKQAADKNQTAEAVRLYEQALAEGFNQGDEPYYYLGCHYMKLKDWKNLKRIIGICPGYVLEQKWAVEAKQLLEQHNGKMPNGWIDLDGGKLANGQTETWAELYEHLKSRFPKFDFDNGDNESKIREEDVDALEEFIIGLERKLQTADELYERKDYRAAAEVYAEFIQNGYWRVEPYIALMEIYDKSQLLEEKKRLMAHTVNHFTELRQQQSEAVLALATEYNCEDFVKRTIADGKRIAYYDGLFDLYSPYPEIEQWQKHIGG